MEDAIVQEQQRPRHQAELDERRAVSTPERERLLNLVVDLILRDGVIDLSLSAISRSIGSNNRMMLYYFGSKEQILYEASVLALERFPRLVTMFDRLAGPEPLIDRLDAAWEDLAAPENRPYLVIFFQRFGMAMRDREQWHSYIDRATRFWVEDLAQILVADGYRARDAVVAATQIVATWRGLQFALLAGADVEVLRTGHAEGVRGLLGRYDTVS
jgi:AcrR family transcriptional regulator